MIVCHICGAQNDPANRFCDQCGARLDPSSPEVESSATGQSQSAAVISCPTCGTEALPGQAFCDHCGYDLRQVDVSTEPTATEAPTQMAEPPVGPDTETVVADVHDEPPVSAPPASGGGEQTAAAAAQPATDTPEPGPVSPDSAPPVTDVSASDAETVAVPMPDAADQADVSSTTATDETVLADSAPSDDNAPAEVAEAPADVAEVPAEGPSSLTRTVDIPDETDEERQRLEEEITRHQDTITQMEQMIQSAAGAAPQYLVHGLEEAQQALKQAEQKLAALNQKVEPDPAEIERLEQVIVGHKNTIQQFESMKLNYPDGKTPTFLDHSLQEARQALQKTEAELTALREGKASPAVPSISSKGPRLELFDGKHEFLLPTDKTDFIVGREDPVSQIYPEIDLTSFGGEAGGVSRQHARIVFDGVNWTVMDLDSTNHTRVDGQKIDPNTPVIIHEGTRVQFGRIAAVFRL